MSGKGNRGAFAPGQSGNPGGRPKQSEGLTEMFRGLTPLAFLVIEDAMRHGTRAEKLAAAREALDRGWGKPRGDLANLMDSDAGRMHLEAIIEHERQLDAEAEHLVAEVEGAGDAAPGAPPGGYVRQIHDAELVEPAPVAAATPALLPPADPADPAHPLWAGLPLFGDPAPAKPAPESPPGAPPGAPAPQAATEAPAEPETAPEPPQEAPDSLFWHRAVDEGDEPDEIAPPEDGGLPW